MKKLLAVIACLGAMAYSAYGQGTVLLANRATAAGLDAPIYDVGGVTKLAGDAFYAQVYAGADAASLAPLGSPMAFRTGSGAGYYIAPSAGVPIPSVAPGAVATIQVRAWAGAAGSTYDAAVIRGQSGIFTVTTGGAGAPPSLPANLVGLTSFPLVPEPSMIALGLLGAAALLIRRRK